MLGAKPVETFMEHGQKLALVNGKLADGAAYRRLVSRLICLVITRPKISYSVHVLSQLAQAPQKEHFETALWVVHYIKCKPVEGILLRAFCDLIYKRIVIQIGQVALSQGNQTPAILSHLGSLQCHGRRRSNAPSEVIGVGGILSRGICN